MRALTLLLVLTLATGGCAASRAQAPRVPGADSRPSVVDRTLMSEYVRQLPVGSRVRVSLSDGRVVHGILLKGDADPIVVQKRTRIPEAPLHVPLAEISSMELEGRNGGTGRAVALGAAAGAGAALGVLMILAAIFAD